MSASEFELPLSQLNTKGGTQARKELQASVVNEYAEALADGVTFPPVTVFFDGDAFWLADGFHRYAAHEEAKLDQIAVDVQKESQREAILDSFGANQTHGLRRTNVDKRRAVMTMLEDDEWGSWPNTEIARRGGVNEGSVRRYKQQLSSEVPKIEPETPSQVTVTRGGTTYTQSTGKIGKGRKEAKSTPLIVVERPHPIPASSETRKYLERAAEMLVTIEIDEARAELEYDPGGYFRTMLFAACKRFAEMLTIDAPDKTITVRADQA